MIKKTRKRRIDKDKKYYTKKLAAENYNTTIAEIKEVFKELEQEYQNTDEAIYKGGKLSELSEKVLDNHYQWHRVLHNQRRGELKMSIFDVYHWLVKHRWSKSKAKRLDKNKYILFISTFFELLRNKIIEENWIWVMPYKMGSIYMKMVTKENESQLPYNRKHFQLTGERIRHSNKHSFGQRFAMRFDRTFATFINKGITEFRAGSYTKNKIRDTVFDRVGPYKKSFVGH